MTTHSAQASHREFVVQQHLIDELVSGEGYFERDSQANYDRKRAMDTELLVQFLRATQSDEWDKLVAQYSTSAEETLFKQLEKELKTRGALDVLRNGIKIVPGIKFSLCFFRPASALSPQRVAEYEANILSVIKEVEYSERHGNRIDIVLFVNGLPIVTLEAKNTLTGTSFKHAEKQYKSDRSPAGEPLLTFKRGALVHFAFDEDNVSMTTRLANGKTRFVNRH
ncbi:type I restriction endonuclease [Ruegeria sp.]|uniref:type I restriction endonuclease n=1 Tax=Ruegeria sp. TaxID=1879320 RepID=UPI003B00B7E8